MDTLRCSEPALRTPSKRALERNGSAVQMLGDGTLREERPRVGGVGSQKTTHRGRAIVRLRVGLTPFRPRNFVRCDPI